MPDGESEQIVTDAAEMYRAAPSKSIGDDTFASIPAPSVVFLEQLPATPHRPALNPAHMPEQGRVSPLIDPGLANWRAFR